MRYRAVILDVYHTLMSIGPGPDDAERRWTAYWEREFSGEPVVTLSDLKARCDAVVAREHAAARRVGVEQPEVYWPDVLREAVPAWGGLGAGALRDAQVFHAGLQRSVGLMCGAGEGLEELRRSGVLLGIASNAQPYTLAELDGVLAGAGLDRGIFEPDLTFWSFEAGFSKPDPHVFRWLTARLAARGIRAAETLMVGDREDNDVLPAAAQGWRTWRLLEAPVGDGSANGPWRDLMAWLGLARLASDRRDVEGFARSRWGKGEPR